MNRVPRPTKGYTKFIKKKKLVSPCWRVPELDLDNSEVSFGDFETTTAGSNLHRARSTIFS